MRGWLRGATRSRYLSSLIGLLVLVGVLLPLNVLAEDSGTDAASEAIALEAAQVIDEHCAAAAGGSATAAAASVAIVSRHRTCGPRGIGGGGRARGSRPNQSYRWPV